MDDIQDENAPTSLETVERAMDKAAALAGRENENISLIAISKTRMAEEILPLLGEGHRLFGENRVQEAAEKWPELRAEYSDIELHMVGQLQSNKADEAIALFDVIHSVDRPSLVKALGKAMQKANRSVPCFIQINIGEEEQKGGCGIADLPGLLTLCEKHGVPVQGLMCVPPLDLEPSPYFALLAQKAKVHGLPLLSMGMSADFEAAVKIGATHIRVGSALFGARN
ncbi:YggS family pyridoxal phosphate-dependent enzyme [Sphingorhabdus sp. Alg239-R122]|uniref:YggS family pyridoxal phosphate-dependent enzyme n=1 Tax=Sphingorhabdus sp. Alg239-R122 TaxID=2305989 RepID=UPI0013DBC0AC|nr:YggS family pyridoxal phosphate-dependent enzyme [Sphingorhabdus sp. Alg239-R122]